MGRGHGKGKRGGRGGGRRQFVSSLEELEARNQREADWRTRKAAGEDGEDGEGEDGEEGGEGGDDDEHKDEAAEGGAKGDANGDGGGGANKEEEKDDEDDGGEQVSGVRFAPPPPARKLKGTEGLIETENPNARKAAPRPMKAKDIDVDAPAPQLSRREREALDAERRKAHYDKLHAEGKTDEAKRDLERLAAVKQRREAAAKEKAEAEAGALKHDGDKGAEAASGKTGGDGFERFGAIEIKKMNPTKLKELLKERSQSLQGSKKDLQMRLIEWEADHAA